MKSIRFVFLKTMIILFFAFDSDLTFSQAAAESHIKTDAVNKVQFVGVEDNFLVFELRFSELPVKGCTLEIMDETGNPFFEEFISGNSFMRRYKLVRDGLTKISFKAVGKGFLFNQFFTIKREEKLIVITE